MTRHEPCHLCHAPRITGGQQVNDGSFTYECGSVIRGAGREPEVRVIGARCARWARELREQVRLLTNALQWIADRPTDPRPDGSYNHCRAAIIDYAREALK